MGLVIGEIDRSLDSLVPGLILGDKIDREVVDKQLREFIGAIEDWEYFWKLICQFYDRNSDFRVKSNHRNILSLCLLVIIFEIWNENC